MTGRYQHFLPRLFWVGTTGLFLAMCVHPMPLRANDQKQASAIDFRRDVQPILAQRCFRCHGPDQAEGGLRLSSRDGAFAELDSGERAVVVGKPQESALLHRVTTDDDTLRMPPEGKPLKPEQVEILSRWIAEGAAWRDHWAFEPLVRPEVPEVTRTQWIRNPIDAFIAKGLEARGLEPAPPASKTALLRRAYYDLTGLPPTPEEVEAFLADDSSDAYERVVDKLLASPHYGERWGRHWLDLVRYAETNSFERDGVKPNAWRYRDYVIRSFNDDKPYDQFVREQLAGDELEQVTTDSLTATGYYRLGLWDDEPADPAQARYDELDDIVATTGQVFLGLTVNCARCHDHKLDPISQADYYQLVAFFNEIPRYHPEGSQMDVSPPEVAEQYQRIEAQKAEVRKQMEPIEQAGIVKMSAEDQRKTEGPERTQVLKEKLKDHLDKHQWDQYLALRAEMIKLNRTKLPPRETVLGVGKCLPEPPKTFVLVRGNPHVPGAEVKPAYLTTLGGGEPSRSTGSALSADRKSAGLRSELANWIVSPENPLTARVLANRLWQYHFGRGIVRSSSNFGNLGTPPTHPELLDWLAAELIRQGWHLKPMHRMIVLSNAYRMSSIADPKALQADPENDLFWRFDMRRLGAEEVRDSMLAASGELNLALYGPSIYPALSKEVLHSQSMPGAGWGTSSPEEQCRRSIYIHVKRSLVVPLLAEFDLCDTDGSCSVRFSTTQPTQALAMLNGDFAHQQASAFANRLRRERPGDVTAQVERGLRIALSSPADPKLVERGVTLIETLQKKHSVSPEKALDCFCLMVLNLNEFMYLE